MSRVRDCLHHDEIDFYITPTGFLKASAVISYKTRDYKTHDILRVPSQRYYFFLIIYFSV